MDAKERCLILRLKGIYEQRREYQREVSLLKYQHKDNIEDAKYRIESVEEKINALEAENLLIINALIT